MGSKLYLMIVRHETFLVADTQLYKRLCPSIRLSVRPQPTSQKVEKRAFECFFGGCVGKGAWGWMPLPSRPQQ